MLGRGPRDAAQLEAELRDMMHVLAAEGQQQGVQYVSVLQVGTSMVSSTMRC